ncbi:MAG TPA: HEPN domain-containing protein [Bryobacteraceae bacterium]|nr:HEPN domain-containing protein [Bryobacteraceae bacterium]
MNRRDFQELAEARLLDAMALFEAKRFDAAYYVAGYVVECALKACVAKRTREHDFPPKEGSRYYQHDLEKLLAFACKTDFERDQDADSVLAGYWDLVTRWNEESRYELRGDQAERLAEDMLLAVSDQEHGVLKCLSKYW